MANGYGDVCVHIRLACSISIAFLAMFVSSCSRFLLSLMVVALNVNVASLRVRLRRLRGPVVCGGSVCCLINSCIRSVPIAAV